MPFVPSLPQHATLLDVFKKFPETNRPLIEFHEALLRGASPFTEAERELIAAYVSALNRCRYCRGVHTATAELLGVESGLVDKLVGDDTLAAAPPKLRPVLDYARKLTLEAAGTTQSDADAVREAGWGDDALYHLVATTALFNYMNRLVEGLGIELDPSYVKPASERLAGKGYLPLLRLMEDA